MIRYPKRVLQPQKSALRFFIGKYLCFWGGLLLPPLALIGDTHD